MPDGTKLPREPHSTKCRTNLSAQILQTIAILGGAPSAVRAQCNYLGVWPYYRPIL